MIWYACWCWRCCDWMILMVGWQTCGLMFVGRDLEVVLALLLRFEREALSLSRSLDQTVIFWVSSGLLMLFCRSWFQCGWGIVEMEMLLLLWRKDYWQGGSSQILPLAVGAVAGRRTPRRRGRLLRRRSYVCWVLGENFRVSRIVFSISNSRLEPLPISMFKILHSLLPSNVSCGTILICTWKFLVSHCELRHIFS